MKITKLSKKTMGTNMLAAAGCCCSCCCSCCV